MDLVGYFLQGVIIIGFICFFGGFFFVFKGSPAVGLNREGFHGLGIRDFLRVRREESKWS
jgi:hypothetical protein